MAVSASRVPSRWSTGHLPDTPGFRRRHRTLAVLLALHLPAIGALAVLTGGAPQDVLVEGAVVVLALAVGAFLDISPRLRSLALTAGLLWSSAVVGLVSATVIWGVLHAATIGLLAAAHVGASWRAPRTGAATAPAGDPAVGAVGADEAAATAQAGRDDGLVEVQEVYTGVWSAQRLVRPRTRLIRLSEEPTAQTPASEPPTADARPEPHGGPVDAPKPDAGDDGSATPAAQRAATVEPSAATALGASAPEAGRDPDLTREVLEALHLGAVEPTPGRDARERVSST